MHRIVSMAESNTAHGRVTAEPDDRHDRLIDQLRRFTLSDSEDTDPRLLDLLLDGVGVALAGRSSRSSRSAASAFGGSDAPWDAAWLHGVCMHALDFDDTHEPSLCHTSTSLLPGLLRLGRARERSGHELLVAFDLGLRLVDFMSECGPALNAKGVHSTAILGSIAAGAACGWLVSRDIHTAADSAEMAALMAAGLGAAFGSDSKHVQAGHAAEVGVRAALFVASGVGAPRGAAFGDRGILALWLGVDAVESLRWTDGCAGAARRVAIKPYPSCFLTHSTIDGIIQLRGSLGGCSPTDVEHIAVGVHPLTTSIADKTSLDSSNDARFSLRYCALAAWSDARVTLDTFEASGQQRLLASARSFADWVAKFSVSTDRNAATLSARLEIGTKDGRTGTITIRSPRGSVSEPLTADDVVAKFRDNASRALDIPLVQRVIDDVMSLPTTGNICELESLTAACLPGLPADSANPRSFHGN
jgi:2-methylcitrate dehydratase PrpD